MSTMQRDRMGGPRLLGCQLHMDTESVLSPCKRRGGEGSEMW